MTTFEEFYNAYKAQETYMIGLMVNAINAIDTAHSERVPLPFLSCMVEDCVKEVRLYKRAVLIITSQVRKASVLRIWQTDFGQLRLLYLMKRKSQWRNLKTHLSIITDKV